MSFARMLLLAAVFAGTSSALGQAPAKETTTCRPAVQEIRAQKCPAGKTGSLLEARRSACPGPQWGQWTTILDACQPEAATIGACEDCTRFHVGPPVVIRGPFSDELDVQFNMVKLPDGRFRGFSANQRTFMIHGKSPLDMGGVRAVVANPGLKDSASECGNWLTDTKLIDNVLYGFFHVERSCRYEPFDALQTHMTISIASSSDWGASWTFLGPVISAPVSSPAKRITGEGNCTAVVPDDGYVYAYCHRAVDWKMIIARASLKDLKPGSWQKWTGKDWSEPALDGNAAALRMWAGSAARWPAGKGVLMVSPDRWYGGLRLWASRDLTTFRPLGAPLVQYDEEDWNRPAATELYAYPSIIDPKTGSNTVEDEFLLAYTYVPENMSLLHRYLVMQKVRVEPLSGQASPQTLTAVSLWRAASGTRISTGPVLPPLRHEATLGQAMTRPVVNEETVELEECKRRVGAKDVTPEFALAERHGCTRIGMSRARPIGWVYKNPAPDRIELSVCPNGVASIAGKGCGPLQSAVRIIGYLVR